MKKVAPYGNNRASLKSLITEYHMCLFQPFFLLKGHFQ